ncbi:unnamed protein product [Polarella glacialis]|nr:unnamed protein product [Polarella glacialis]CAE8741955.1 unnamed protein product [Polarella glacialis]
MSLDRVMSSSAASLRGQGWSSGADATASALPSASGEAAASESKSDEAGDGKDDGKGKGKGKKGKLSVKDQTKIKRTKGQSGVDHNGLFWKPEAWMKMRQDFD